MKKYFFGLDLSLNSTGISVFTFDDMQFVETSTIAVDKSFGQNAQTKDKLNFIGTELLKYKKAYGPSFVVIEAGFARFIKSTAQLMRVHGVANYVFHDIDQYEIPPTQIKLQLTGKGNSKKPEVAKAVHVLYPTIRFTTDDESDACAVAICWGMKMGWLNKQ